MNSIPRIREGESEVMEVVWDRHPQTAMQIVQALMLHHPWIDSKIRAMVGRLVQKRALGVTIERNGYYYHSLITREQCIEKMSDTFLDRVFLGAPGLLRIVSFAGTTWLSSVTGLSVTTSLMIVLLSCTVSSKDLTNTEDAGIDKLPKSASTFIVSGKVTPDKSQTPPKLKESSLTGDVNPGISGQIISINTKWNFVVLNIGKEQGVAANGEFIVTRDKDNIGRVRVANAEASFCVADVLLDSLKGTLRVGDNVTLPAASAEVERLNKLKESSPAADMNSGIRGQIISINTNWSFVVLNIGEKQGVAANSEFMVSRGKNNIGKVRVTHTEADTCVADVLLYSVKGTLKVGDNVTN